MNNTIARPILAISLFIATLSWSGFAMLRTTLNPDRSDEIANELANNDSIKQYLAQRITANIENQVPEVNKVVSKEEIQGTAVSALDNPTVHNVLVKSLANFHRQVLEGNVQPLKIQSPAISESLKSSDKNQNKALANTLQSKQIEINIPTDSLNNVSKFRNLLTSFVPIGLLLSSAGIVFSILVAGNRPKIFRRLAYWSFFTAFFWIVASWVIPSILLNGDSPSKQFFKAILKILTGQMLIPSLALLGFGIAMYVISFLWPKGKLSHNTKNQNQPPGWLQQSNIHSDANQEYDEFSDFYDDPKKEQDMDYLELQRQEEEERILYERQLREEQILEQNRYRNYDRYQDQRDQRYRYDDRNRDGRPDGRY